MKLRMSTWYWGKFVLRPFPNTSINDYEEYIEEIHGWHNSEEFKKETLNEKNEKPKV